MSKTQKILDGIKKAIHEGVKVSVDLNEASSLTGSGLDVGGRTHFDDAFAALRYANPFRMGSRQISVPNNSAVQFVAKTGNALTQANPWGYTFTPNAGTPNTSTTIWQLPVRVLSAQLPIRSAVLSDINYLEESVVEDLALEFASQEGASMAANDDQTGTTTATTGGEDGLRGLDSYVSASASAYGTSGTAITNGIHSIATVSLSGGAIVYDNIAAAANKFPAQYWGMEGNAWHISPAMIQTLRQLKDDQNLPQFLELGEPNEGGAIGSIFGWPVIPNSFLTAAFPIYLANWPRFLTIADVENMSLQMLDQSAPGFVTIYAEKRLASTVRDPFAGVRVAA